MANNTMNNEVDGTVMSISVDKWCHISITWAVAALFAQSLVLSLPL